MTSPVWIYLVCVVKSNWIYSNGSKLINLSVAFRRNNIRNNFTFCNSVVLNNKILTFGFTRNSAHECKL